MNNSIHQTAIISKDVKLGNNNHIGPFCIIEGNIDIGDNNNFISHCVIKNNVKIGNGNTFFEFSSIGNKSQDKKANDDMSELFVKIGNGNTFREGVTVHTGTQTGSKITEIEDNCLFMANVHIAHDCIIKSSVTIANNTGIAGHVVVNKNVVIGGGCGVHQFCEIGEGAMIGAMSAIGRNILPFSIITSRSEKYKVSFNIVGAKRKLNEVDQKDTRAVYRIMLRDCSLDEKIDAIEKLVVENEENKDRILNFLKKKFHIEGIYL